jgi:NAD(P)-dependent dehydrogenase (short-subunit alcohol dehydrogenase family)
MNIDLSGRVACVTGAGSGIGLSAARAFREHGARVLVTDMHLGHAERAAQTIGGSDDVIALAVDVTQPDQVQSMVATAQERFGSLDFAFNNAGIGGAQASTADYTVEQFRQVLEVNLVAVWLCMKYELAAMLTGGAGSIVNNASILGRVGFANAPAYVAAKHGVLGLTKTAAIEYATRGIRVNAVCPGFIMTPMLEQAGITSGNETSKAIADLHPMHRLGRPEEVAEAVVWLCSDAASFVTGESLMVDGGYIAQ